MKLSKRQFMKLGIGGMAGVILAPMLKPGSLLASPVVLPHDYLDSVLHGQWMKLSYNQGRESRQTRRCLGAALRNIGAIKGRGLGDAFARVFDLAVQRAFVRRQQGLSKPGNVLGLVQSLYEETIFPAMGPAGGRVLFGTLLAVLRGRDGTAQGEAAHRAYLAYRAACLEHKDAYRRVQDPKELDLIRKNRAALRGQWQSQLGAMATAYALRQRRLGTGYFIGPKMMEGFDVYVAPLLIPGPRLSIARIPQGIRVSWNGPAQLLQAPTPLGPWTPANQKSPAIFDGWAPQQYFRTVQPVKPATQ